jgi:peptide chain release factor 2
LDGIQAALKARRLRALMSSEQDQAGCYLEIVSGAGGADAFHWTKMLANMYSKWASKSGYVVTYVDEQHDDSAGGVGGQGISPLFHTRLVVE